MLFVLLLFGLYFRLCVNGKRIKFLWLEGQCRATAFRSRVAKLVDVAGFRSEFLDGRTDLAAKLFPFSK